MNESEHRDISAEDGLHVHSMVRTIRERDSQGKPIRDLIQKIDLVFRPESWIRSKIAERAGRPVRMLQDELERRGLS